MVDNARIDELFAEMWALLPDCDTHHARQKTTELLGLIDSIDARGTDVLDADADARIVGAAQTLMVRNIQTPLPISELAEACGISSTRLKNAFRAVLDTSVFQWYRALRIERAQQLLLETNLPISRVAAAVGYANPSKFSKAFQEHVGESPRTWRSAKHREIAS